jgi:hypothetical protein
MSDFLVSKLDEAELDSVEDKDFDSEESAETYARETSLHDKFYSYSVKKKVDDYEYESIKIYKLGKIITQFKS